MMRKIIPATLILALLVCLSTPPARSQSIIGVMAETLEAIWNILRPEQLKLIRDYQKNHLEGYRKNIKVNADRLFKLLRELETTPDQQAQLIELWESRSHDGEIQRVVESTYRAGLDLENAIEADELDEAQLGRASRALAAAIGEVAVLGYSSMKEVRSILDPRQMAMIIDYKNTAANEYRVALNDLPGFLDASVDLWKKFDIRPSQIKALFNLRRIYLKIASSREELQDELYYNDLGKILSPKQVSMIKDFERNNFDECWDKASSPQNEAMDVWTEFDLDREQVNGIANVFEKYKGEIPNSTINIFERSITIIDMVLAGDAGEDELRKACDALGPDITRAAKLGAGMIKDASGHLNDKQIRLVNEIVEQSKTDIDHGIREYPAFQKELIELLKNLDITPDQQKQLLQLAEQKAKENIERLDALSKMFSLLDVLLWFE